MMKGGGFVAGTSSAGGCTAARTCARSEGSSMALRSAASTVPPQQVLTPHLVVQRKQRLKNRSRGGVSCFLKHVHPVLVASTLARLSSGTHHRDADDVSEDLQGDR